MNIVQQFKQRFQQPQQLQRELSPVEIERLNYQRQLQEQQRLQLLYSQQQRQIQPQQPQRQTLTLVTGNTIPVRQLNWWRA